MFRTNLFPLTYAILFKAISSAVAVPSVVSTPIFNVPVIPNISVPSFIISGVNCIAEAIASFGDTNPAFGCRHIGYSLSFLTNTPSVDEYALSVNI